MRAAVAHAAQGQQVTFAVVAAATASMGVMDLQLRSPAALLAPPAVALEWQLRKVRAQMVKQKNGGDYTKPWRSIRLNA